jgi:hypothetical protein
VVSGNVADALPHGGLLALSVFVVLVAWKYPAALPPSLLRVRNWLAGPFSGAAAALASFMVIGYLSSVVSLIYAVSSHGRPLSASDISPRLIVPVLLSPNVFLAAFAFGQGVPITATGNVAGGLKDLGGRPGFLNVLDAADKEPRVWIAVAVVAFVLLVGGVVSAFFATTPSAARKRGWSLGVSLSVLLAVIALVTRLSFGGRVLGQSLDAGAGLDVGYAALIGMLWGAVAGSRGALLAPALPAHFVMRRRQRIEQRRADRMLVGAGTASSSGR